MSAPTDHELDPKPTRTVAEPLDEQVDRVVTDETTDPGSPSVDRTSVPSGRRDLAGRRRAVGGVEPVVRPGNRAARRATRRRLRRGVTPVSPGRPKVAHRILPRTVIGISGMFFAAGVGAAVAGASFYAYYDHRLAENERTVARFVESFDTQFADAAGQLDQVRVDAIADIRAELGPLSDQVTEANGIAILPELVGPSVWRVDTRDDAGRPVVGSAFAVGRHQGGTALVTSLSVVLASTVEPGPGISLTKADRVLTASLWAWDEERDLALIVVPDEIPVLELADADGLGAAVGGRVFAIGGIGSGDATASPGVLLDAAVEGVQHTAAVGTFFRGGPLVTAEGVVVGVAGDGYRPLGVDPGSIGQAPTSVQLCSTLLACADDVAGATPAEGSPGDGVDGATDGEPADGE